VIAVALVFSVTNLMNCVHNVPTFWDVNIQPSQEDQELAWHRVSLQAI